MLSDTQKKTIAQELWWPHHSSRTRSVALEDLNENNSLGIVNLSFGDFISIVENLYNQFSIPTNCIWQTMDNAPTDDREFLIGGWVGEKYWNEDHTKFVFVGDCEWVVCKTHHENPDGPYTSRGWNHRNGPFEGAKDCLWTDLPTPPILDKNSPYSV